MTSFKVLIFAAYGGSALIAYSENVWLGLLFAVLGTLALIGEAIFGSRIDSPREENPE